MKKQQKQVVKMKEQKKKLLRKSLLKDISYMIE